MGRLMTGEHEQIQVNAIVAHIDDCEKSVLDIEIGEWVDCALPSN